MARIPRAAAPVSRLLDAALVSLLMVLPLGCSISDSFSDSSKSFSDSSASLSKSSSPDDSKSAYRHDIREYTAAYTKSGGQFDAFQKKLGELAKKHDVTNWEDELATYRGVGEGLGQGAVSQTQLATYMDGLARSDAQKRQAMQEGYAAVKP